MTKNSIPIRERRSSEDGYVLIAVIFLLFLFALAMTVAAPMVARQIQLDREHETMEVGKQYVRAIQLYYRKFHAYPPSIDALVKTDDIRFLRKKYKDPMDGKDDWRIIHFGQAKTQTLGFFGQPLAGATGGSAGGTVMAGVGPGGGNPATGNSMSGGGSGLGGSGLSGGSLFGNSGSTTSGPNGSSGASGSTGGTGSSGSGGSGTGSGSGLGSGQTFGGVGIIGVAPGVDKPSIMIFKKMQRYNQWEFIYDPLMDMKTTTSGGIPGAQPAGGTTTPGSSSPFGNSGSPFGGSGSGTTTPAPSPSSGAPTPQPQ